MQVVGELAAREGDIEITEHDLENTGYYSPVPTLVHPEQEFAQPSGLLGVDSKDASGFAPKFGLEPKLQSLNQNYKRLLEALKVSAHKSRGLSTPRP